MPDSRGERKRYQRVVLYSRRSDERRRPGGRPWQRRATAGSAERARDDERNELERRRLGQ